MMNNENLNSDEFECCIKNVNRESRFFKLTRNKERLVILDAFILFSGIALQHFSRNLAVLLKLSILLYKGKIILCVVQTHAYTTSVHSQQDQPIYLRLLHDDLLKK